MRRARIAVAVVVVSFTLGLAGSAQAGATVTVGPDTLNFGQEVVGTTSETLAITFSNSGTVDVEFQGAAGAGYVPGTDFDGQPGGFELVDITCGQGTQGAVIPAGQTCDASFEFTPTAVGQRSVVVDWVDLDGGVVFGSTTLAGEGVPPCSRPTGPVSGPLHGLLNPLGLGAVSSLVCELGL